MCSQFGENITDDVRGMLEASGAGVKALQGLGKPYFTFFDKVQFPGRTWGIVPLGVHGMTYLSDADLRNAPPRTPRPKGYDYTYDLLHQGLTTNVTCRQMTDAEQGLIRLTVGNSSQEQIATVQCAGRGDMDITETALGPGYFSPFPNVMVLPCPSTNGTQHSSRTHTVFFKMLMPPKSPGVLSDLGSIALDTTCVFEPYWHTMSATYSSDQNALTLGQSTFQSYVDRMDGGLFAPTAENDDNQSFARKELAGEVFFGLADLISFLNTVSSFDLHDAVAFDDNILETMLGNVWLRSLANAVDFSTSSGNHTIPYEIIAASLQAMFDYQSSAGENMGKISRHRAIFTKRV
ncbi:hypothetical protein OC845_005942 [Tilletia horrida]|nr:hypothetical protein OC845_005942 [Tilletia horrida]